LKQEKGKHFEKLLLRLYIKYSNIQIIKAPKKRIFDRKEYSDANISLLRLWNWIATPTTVLVLVVSSCLYKPTLFFFYILGAANIWMLVLWIIQTRTIRKLIRKTSA
jgi:Flp pilus assembly protein TadB